MKTVLLSSALLESQLQISPSFLFRDGEKLVTEVAFKSSLMFPAFAFLVFVTCLSNEQLGVVGHIRKLQEAYSVLWGSYPPATVSMSNSTVSRLLAPVVPLPAQD